MSKLSILDQKIADIKAKRDACMLQVKMFDQVLDLLESPVADAAPEKPAVQRAARGSVQAAVLGHVTLRPMSIDELETAMIPAVARSSIRKALTALAKDNKVTELHDGKWALKSAVRNNRGFYDQSAEPGDFKDDASVRED